MKKEIIIILLLLLISSPAVKSILLPGGFTSHDLTHHVVRQIDMDKLLSEGQFPPRWSGELNNGYGYPVFLFNYPLPAMLGEVFHKIGFNFVTSVKAVLLTSMVLSVLGMFLFLKSYLSTNLAPFLGAMFYLYAPHRFLNIYVSAAVGSALGDALVPFVFWSMVEIKKSQKWVLKGALFFALLVLSHNITTLIFSPLILGFAVVLILQSEQKVAILKKLLLMFLLGIALSAWFWLPALVEKQYILFDQIYQGFYKDQFINLWQLIRSPWGYGLSHPQNPQPGDMSYQLGLIQIAVMLLLLGSAWFFRRIREFRVIGGISLSLFALSIFLMQKISLPLWQNLPFLSLVQFPLRFQAISIFSASIGAALLIKYLPFKKLLFGLLLILVIYANRNHWNINEKFDPGEDYYLSQKTTTASFNEHLPKWGRAMERPALSKLEFMKGAGNINVLKNESAFVLAEVEAKTPAVLRFNQFFFPGWEMKVDERPVKFNYLTEGESYGLPVFNVMGGKHLIMAEFKNTSIRSLADTISLIGVIVWVVYLCKLLIRR